MKEEDIKLFDAIKMMRRLTKIGVPFSMEFKTWNDTKKTTEGIRVVDKALLRTGFRKDQSDHSETIVAFYEYPGGLPRFFHIELLQRFNGRKVIP